MAVDSEFERLRSVYLTQRERELAYRHQEGGVPVVRHGAPRFQCECALEFAACSGHVARPIEIDKGEICMRIAERRFECNGPLRRRLGAWIGFLRWHGRKFAQEIVTVCQPRIGFGVTGVVHDSLGEVIDRGGQADGRTRLPLIKPGPVERDGLDVSIRSIV